MRLPGPKRALRQPPSTPGVHPKAEIEGHLPLAKEPEELFRLIRHLRGRYGVFNSPRRRKPEACDICGEYQVRSAWVGSRIGPRSVEVKRCRNCGHETREEPSQGRRQIIEIDGKPIQAPGGVSAADRAAFAARLAAARKQQNEGEREER